ncbi:hypothetical protein GIB67_028359 [Kingdonia uniflora]|uniref:Uncharacterized protein n=1 Tax=Kingdonia uniflora TaxID=39325 RepID=A0A7J7MHW6_9MAGN|nr:hypothetical protein GIB67_028359 [Kingdonia uniflora]
MLENTPWKCRDLFLELWDTRTYLSLELWSTRSYPVSDLRINKHVTYTSTVTPRPPTQAEHGSSTTDVSRTSQHTLVSHELAVTHLTAHDSHF